MTTVEIFCQNTDDDDLYQEFKEKLAWEFLKLGYVVLS